MTNPLVNGEPLSRRIRQSAQVVSSRLGDAGVLVHLQTNRIFEVNATGLRIWELAGQGRTLGEIEQTLRGEFDVEPGRLRSELLALVAELSREGLVDDDDDPR
jgi:hypothetical protein